MDAATVKFQQALPYVLLPVSSQLAALHTIRTQAPTPSSCLRCGSDLSASSTTRLKRTATKQRIISTTCSSCGTCNTIPIDTGNTASFPSWKKARLSPLPHSTAGEAQAQLSHVPTAVLVPSLPKLPTPVLGPTPASNPETVHQSRKIPSHSAKTAKKKPGLQEMLQRNRDKDKDKRAKTAETKSTGLSAFLSTL
ncbi:hypothetical protein CPC08DRAFT_814207 [Agrocybe pediades]|nr:hypothetical protein CPC08DRAFT_814207 [Agrocybe pediades]